MPDAARATAPPAHTVRQGQLRLPDPFRLVHGERLDTPSVAYADIGPLAGTPRVVLGGISADRHVDRWWRDLIGPGRPIDTTRDRVIAIDWLGTRTESFPRDPSATIDGPGQRRYPLISTRDQARALVAVLDALGIDAVPTFVGASYGGMVGLAAAADFPSRFPRLVIVSAAHRSHPMATAHRAIQRGIVDLGRASGDPSAGLALARALAMTTYRTADEFEARFDTTPLPDDPGGFEVESYLAARGDAFRARFDPDAFAALSHSIDLHRVDPRRVGAETTLVSVDSDHLVPAWLVDELEHGLAGPCLRHRLTSRWGHDAFLKEPTALGEVISSARPEPCFHV